MASKVKVLHCHLFVIFILILSSHCVLVFLEASVAVVFQPQLRTTVPRRSAWSPQHQSVTSVACPCSPSIAVTCSLHSLLDRISKWRCWKVSTSLQRTAHCSSGALSMALSTRQRCVLYKLTFVQPVNKFPAFYAIRGFMIVSRGSRHWSVSSARHSSHIHPHERYAPWTDTRQWRYSSTHS
jgi:hypothetical protein